MNNTSTNPRPVLFHLITGFQVGGAERMLARVLPRLPRFRHVVISLTADGPMRIEYKRLGIETAVLGFTHPLAFGFVGRWHSLVQTYRPAILTTYLLHADVVGRILGRLWKIPHVVSSLRARFRQAHVPRLLRWARRLDGLVDRYIAVSEEVRRYYIEDLHFPAEKFTTITNGLDPSQYQTQLDASGRAKLLTEFGLPTTSFIIGTVSQLRAEKGVDRLIEAMNGLRQEPHIHCLIIGDGIEKKKLQARANGLGLADRIHFLGNRDDIPALLPLLDIFILPSWFEGMSNALLEAMATARPIIVTDTTENREVITPGTGYLIETNTGGFLASAVLRLIQKPREREEAGQRARLRLEQHFALSAKTRQLDELYTSLLAL